MRRLLTLVCLLCLAIPAGISISGCTRNPAGNYCNGLGYGLKDTAVASIDLEPRNTGISLSFGQTQQISAPIAKTCKGASATVSNYTYATTNNQLVDVSPTGNMCAGTWNRNSGGGIPNYTICSKPNPLPLTDGVPFASAYISASGDSVTSNPVEVYVHAQVTAISLSPATQPRCYSQGELTQLDSQAYYSNNGVRTLLCAPSTPGLPNCSTALGNLAYAVGTPTVASINTETNQITAEHPGTTTITATISGSGSVAGYFSTCPPEKISISLSNGATSGIVTQGVQQNLVTTVTDTRGNPVTGILLDYQSTNPIDIEVGNAGSISASFPGAASVYAICQPYSCNSGPINQIGLFGTGLSISSNPVSLVTPGTASSYVWYSAPGKSQYFVPVELISGTIGSTVRLPYVPNSMVMDTSGTTLYFGSSRELMSFSTLNNTLLKQDPNAPGIVLAVSPNNSTVVINDQQRQLFYLYSPGNGTSSTFGGLGNSAAWTPDSKTLYISDSAALGAGHTDTLYVYNVNTGWTTYDLSASGGAQNLTLTIPGVGAYLSGNPTVAHTWCPTGTVGDYATMSFYPQGDSVSAQTDILASTSDGQHILGAAMIGGGVTLSDIGVTIPYTACPGSVTLQALTIPHTLNQTPVNINATAINTVVAGSLPVAPSSTTSPSLAFLTYNGNTPGATLPYYLPDPGNSGKLGTLGYVTLTGSSAITAPLAGAFSPDDTLFFVSTAGDNKIHYIDLRTLTDTQQISPNLPGADGKPVPATAIAVKPRSTT